MKNGEGRRRHSPIPRCRSSRGCASNPLAVFLYYGISVLCFLRIWSRARTDDRPSAIQEPAMAEPSTTSRPREAPAVEAAARIVLRRKTADQRLRIQERLTMGLTVAHIARVEQLDGAAGAADHRGDARQPRDRSAPRLRSIADSPAERSDDRRANDDDAGQSPGDGSMDQVDERTRPLPGFSLAQIPSARDAAAQPRLAAPEPAISNRGVSLAGRGPDWSAENDLKRLNPRPEVVWARKPRTHKMWYTGAR